MQNQEIRKRIKELRKSLSKSQILVDSQKIFENFLTLNLTKEKNFFIYKSFNGEVDTSLLIATLLGEKKTLAFPVIQGENMVAGIPASKEQKVSKFGTEEPKDYIPMDKVDVCVLPLLACDLSFNRLGYGKGYYDKFLKGKDCLKIGLCYDFQVVENIIAKEWDIPLDIIITPTKIIKREI